MIGWKGCPYGPASGDDGRRALCTSGVPEPGIATSAPLLEISMMLTRRRGQPNRKGLLSDPDRKGLEAV